MYAFIYIGVAIVKIPKKNYLLSNIDKSLDYFQFKTYKTYLRIKDNNENVLEYLHQCKLTMEFIQEKEEIGNYSNVEEIETEKKEEESNDDSTNNNNIITNINISEMNNGDNKEDKKDDKNKKDKKKKINIKELINNKHLLNLLESHIKEVMKENTINYDENEKLDKNMIIFGNKSEIIAAKEKLKIIERENEKYNCVIPYFYLKWNYYKTLKMYSETSNEIKEEKESEEKLNEDNFTPSPLLSKSKIIFYKKWHKTYYITITILSIIVGIIIILSENTLIFPVNISSFNIIFTGGGFFSYLAYFLYVFCLLFYSTYSTKFASLKLFSVKFRLMPKNKTDSISFLSFIGTLSDFMIPLCTNIITILKHGNLEYLQTVIESIGDKKINTGGFAYFQKYISLIIIVTVIITYYHLAEKVCKKKRVFFSISILKKEINILKKEKIIY